MKKLFLTFALLLTCAIGSFAQNANVTKFLGIPVDGSKTAMIQKLQQKGFKYDRSNDYLTGEFNGRAVDVFVATNNNKVWRIMLSDKIASSETDIKIRFNTLCNQFKNNKKYIPANLGFEDYQIPEEEDVSFNMTVSKKRYEASYWQTNGEQIDSTTFDKDVENLMLSKYAEYADIKINSLSEDKKEELKHEVINDILGIIRNKFSKRSVWFMITDDGFDLYGQYRILMYYDNEYNHSNGEDL